MVANSQLKAWIKRNIPVAVRLWERWHQIGWRMRVARYARRGREYAFLDIYRRGGWGGQSLSGPGSSDDETAAVRNALPGIFSDFAVRSMIDAPCGDFHWMRAVPLAGIQYVGLDLLPPLIEANSRQYADESHRFAVADLVTTPLPAADLFFCRDCIVHLSLEDAQAAVRNIARSGSRYLMCTTFPATATNVQIVSGEWRAVNMQRPPFDFPEPLRLVNEKYPGGGFADKSMGLWRIADLVRPDVRTS